mgnify:CR=1 FL=1
MTLAPGRTSTATRTGDFAVQCGDWAPLGPTPLTDAGAGHSGAGGTMTSVERTPSDTSTGWAASQHRPRSSSKNVDADPRCGAVSWTRIDNATTPNRYPSSIFTSTPRRNHAWVSYSGFDANTPPTARATSSRPDNPANLRGRPATWVDRSQQLGRPAGHRRRARRGHRRRLRIRATSRRCPHASPAGSSSWELAAPGHAERRGHGPDHGLPPNGCCTRPRTASGPGGSEGSAENDGGRAAAALDHISSNT